MIDDPWFSVAALIARVLLSAAFLVSAIEKSRNFSRALEEFSEARIPVLRFATIATIAVQYVASICLIAGWFVSEMAIVLALFTLVATIRVHDFWNMVNPERLIRSRVFLANLGMVGGLILLAAVGPGSLAL